MLGRHCERSRWLHLAVIVAVVSIFLAVGYVSAVEQQAPDKNIRGQAEPNLPGVKVLRDLEYIPGGHERNKLDLYLPEKVEASEKAKKLPLIIWVHGGAWLGGTRRAVPRSDLCETATQWRASTIG